ncbi:hypothetical protein TCAL_14693 [Tigriopus californicus]|uniref:Uncharacterized protein n=1 Tax=Tigriopus californicus TaxID=6832 RepID=A0A553NNU6_TIGCA|nr:hypothetical protein TCAL_14693 [Tigriopus californicus]
MSMALCGGLESAKMQLPGMSTQLNPGYLQDRKEHNTEKYQRCNLLKVSPPETFAPMYLFAGQCRSWVEQKCGDQTGYQRLFMEAVHQKNSLVGSGYLDRSTFIIAHLVCVGLISISEGFRLLNPFFNHFIQQLTSLTEEQIGAEMVT